MFFSCENEYTDSEYIHTCSRFSKNLYTFK